MLGVVTGVPVGLVGGEVVAVCTLVVAVVAAEPVVLPVLPSTRLLEAFLERIHGKEADGRFKV